jgi:hypothetical protein
MYNVTHCFIPLKKVVKAEFWWFAPVILAIWEAEIKRIVVQDRPGK